MGLSNKIREFLGLFDAYSSPFKVQFRYKTLFQTNYGGIISFIFYVIILAAFVFLYVLVHKKEEQKIVSFDLRYSAPAQFVLNLDNNSIVYSTNATNSAFFLIGFYMTDKTNNNKILNDTEIEENFNLILKSRNRQTSMISNDKLFTYKKCETAFPKEVTLLRSSFLKYAYCIEADSIDLQGEFLSMSPETPFNYLSISLRGKKPDIPVENYQFTLLYTDYSINNKIHDKSPIVFSVKPLQMDLISTFYLSYDVNMALDEFNSQDNLYAHWVEMYQQKMGRVNKISQRVQNLNKNTLEYVSITIKSDFYYKKYIRTFKTFFEFISQIGGLLKVFTAFGGLLVIGVNIVLMKVSISNQIYNMINPANEKEVLLTYEECVEKESNNRITAPIFLSLNPVLKHIAFEYYRYERNRGMNYTIKEALSKVCCCCCKIKKIEQKVKIFDESGKEIEKILDTTSVTRFAQQSQQLKTLLLGSGSVMMNYMVRQNISYKTLNLIKKDLIHNKIMNNSTPISLSYYKQNFLVSGLVTLRNQGDLTKKDLILINEMQLNPDLIGKFFITYYDRLKLIYPEKFKNVEGKNEEARLLNTESSASGFQVNGKK